MKTSADNNIQLIDTDVIDGIERNWYQVTGYDRGADRIIEGEYALCSDGSVLNCDGYPMTPGDRETIAVKNLIESAK